MWDLNLESINRIIQIETVAKILKLKFRSANEKFYKVLIT